jgi:TonB family protein
MQSCRIYAAFALVAALLTATPALSRAQQDLPDNVLNSPERLKETAGRLRVGTLGIQEPAKTHDVPPAFPDVAVRAGATGTVYLDLLIGREGTVDDVKVLAGHALFNQAAIDAVSEWQFTPTTLNGEPIEVLMTVTIRFPSPPLGSR